MQVGRACSGSVLIVQKICLRRVGDDNAPWGVVGVFARDSPANRERCCAPIKPHVRKRASRRLLQDNTSLERLGSMGAERACFTRIFYTIAPPVRLQSQQKKRALCHLEAFSTRLSRAPAASRGRLRSEEGITMFDHAFRVLVGFDSSSASQEALRLALDQACEHPLSQVHVVRVLPRLSNSMIPGPSAVPGATFGYLGLESDFARTDEDSHAAHMDLRLEVAEIFENWAQTKQCWIETVEVHTRFDDPVRGILTLADDLDANLLVMGTRARGGLHRMLFGSVAEKVMRESKRPVLIAHSAESDAHVPAIEPPCPECTKVRFETSGARQWCARHQEHHAFGRARHYSSRPLQPSMRTL